MKSLSFLNADIAAYTVAHTTPPDELLRELTEETIRATGDRIALQISPEQGPLLTMLTRLAGALDASLTIRLDDNDSAFVFTPHHGPRPGEPSTDGHTSAA